MSVWERSNLTMTGSELEVQEALVAMQRVLDGAELNTEAREVLADAMSALRDEAA
jgi:hypothetical protein